MNLYSEYYPKIATYRYNFEKLLEILDIESDFEKKLDIAICSANYFVYNNTGYFTSSVLENFFVDCAKKLKVDISDIKYHKNTILHVISEGYKIGGHTRVVERWIENAPAVQKHSVVFTRNRSVDLNVLENNVKNKKGEYLTLEDETSLIDKAIKLREIAMEYEYVVLHTHMDDPIPIIAFGVEEFNRPVLLYNHASHMAWIGKSIADLVLDIKKDDDVTLEKRGIKNTYFLGVPTQNSLFRDKTDKNEIKKRLNIPLDKKIIVTSGAAARYREICGNNFVDYLKNIMDEDTYCYVIGVNPKTPAWQKIKKDTNNRVKILGFVNFNEGFLDYLKVADLYLDSYPLPGGTAVIDAISSGVPVLSLKSVYPQFDYLSKTSAYCQTKEEFISKAKKVLNNKVYADELFEEVKSSLLEYQSIETWNRKIEKLFEIAPRIHKVKKFVGNKDYCENNDLSVLCNVIINKDFLSKRLYKFKNYKDVSKCIKYGNLYRTFGIPFVFQVLFYKKWNKKIKVYKIFNKDFCLCGLHK